MQTLVLNLNWYGMHGGPKIWHIFVRLNFTKYSPIFKIISLPESQENL